MMNIYLCSKNQFCRTHFERIHKLACGINLSEQMGKDFHCEHLATGYYRQFKLKDVKTNKTVINSDTSFSSTLE